MKYKAVLFDMDGTVLDTAEDLKNALNYALGKFSLPPQTRAQVMSNLGNGAKYLVEHSIPAGTDGSLTAQVLAIYKPYYDAHCRILTRPYDGILPLMKRLKAEGVRLAIISNKPDTAVKELAESFFPGMLETALGETPSIRRKPAPDTVLAAAELMGLHSSDCVYIGDTEVDIATAANAGMDCIAVSWGFRTKEHLIASGAKRIADTPDELDTLLI